MSNNSRESSWRNRAREKELSARILLHPGLTPLSSQPKAGTKSSVLYWHSPLGVQAHELPVPVYHFCNMYARSFQAMYPVPHECRVPRCSQQDKMSVRQVSDPCSALRKNSPFQVQPPQHSASLSHHACACMQGAQCTCQRHVCYTEYRPCSEPNLPNTG